MISTYSSSNSSYSTIYDESSADTSMTENNTPSRIITTDLDSMIKMRNHVMPPPPHSYLNNNSTTKNFNNVSSYWYNQRSEGGGGDCIGASLSCDIKTDENQHSLTEVKGIKRLYSTYGTQQSYYQSIGSYSSNNFHCNNRPHDVNVLSTQTNNTHQNKRRYQNNILRSGTDRLTNRRRSSNNMPSQHHHASQIAPDRYLQRAHEVEVRSPPPALCNGSDWDALSAAIWDRFSASQQTVQMYKEKMSLWKSLYVLIKAHFPRYGLFLVGSTISGFGSNSSDMDMCLFVRQTEVDQRCEAVVHLEIVLKLLKQCDFIESVELIQAKVPILKFRDCKRNLEVDLNCNNSVGIRNTHLLRCYANADWRVRPLVLIVKLWARHHSINDAKNMTISSYSLALMVIHFLQCGVSPPVVPCLQGIYQNKFSPTLDIHLIDMHEQLSPFKSDNTQTLGELLVGFLGYYASFKYCTQAISVRLAARIPIDECRYARAPKNDPHQWKYLCIEEPFDLTNTARSVYDPDIFEHIKAVFAYSFRRLKDTCDLGSVFEKNTRQR